jgi:hypothetical protein
VLLPPVIDHSEASSLRLIACEDLAVDVSSTSFHGFGLEASGCGVQLGFFAALIGAAIKLRTEVLAGVD